MWSSVEERVDQSCYPTVGDGWRRLTTGRCLKQRGGARGLRDGAGRGAAQRRGTCSAGVVARLGARKGGGNGRGGGLDRLDSARQLGC